MRSLLVMGEALTDTVHLADGSSRSHPGGSPANVAIALGRLGWAPQLLTWIADDPAGRDISRWLAESGVALDERSWGAQRTTSARANIDGVDKLGNSGLGALQNQRSYYRGAV